MLFFLCFVIIVSFLTQSHLKRSFSYVKVISFGSMCDKATMGQRIRDDDIESDSSRILRPKSSLYHVMKINVLFGVQL